MCFRNVFWEGVKIGPRTDITALQINDDGINVSNVRILTRCIVMFGEHMCELDFKGHSMSVANLEICVSN